MKLANTKQGTSTVGASGKGFRKTKGGGMSRQLKAKAKGARDAPVASAVSAVTDPSTVLSRRRKWKVNEISWKTLRISDAIVGEMAGSMLGQNVDLPEDQSLLLATALKVFGVTSLQFIVASLGGDEVPSTKASLIPIIVNLILSRSNLTAKGSATLGSVVSVSPKKTREDSIRSVQGKQKAATSSIDISVNDSMLSSVDGKQKATTSSSGGSIANDIMPRNDTEPFHHPKLRFKWTRKTCVRKSGKSKGQTYYQYIGPHGDTFSSLKKAIGHDNIIKTLSLPTYDSDVSWNSREDHINDTLAVNEEEVDDCFYKSGVCETEVYGKIERALVSNITNSPALKNFIYFETLAVSNDEDTKNFNELRSNYGFKATTGASINEDVTSSKIDPLATIDIAQALATYFRNEDMDVFDTREKILKFIHLLLESAGNAKTGGYFIDTGTVVKEWLMESADEISSGKAHTIQWYFTLSHALSRFFGMEIILLLPPDGNNLASGTRMLHFPHVDYDESDDNHKETIVFRLIIDRGMDIQGRVGDGGENVVGVTVCTYSNPNAELSEDDSMFDDSDSDDDEIEASVGSVCSSDNSIMEDKQRSVSTNAPLNADAKKRKAASKAIDGVKDRKNTKKAISSGHLQSRESPTRSLFTTPVRASQVDVGLRSAPFLEHGFDYDRQQVEMLQKKIEEIEKRRAGASNSEELSVAAKPKGKYKTEGLPSSNGSGIDDGRMKGIERVEAGVQPVKSSNNGDWPDSVDMQSILSKSPSPSRGANGSVTLEVSYPFTNKNTGEKCFFLLFTDLGRKAWYTKGATITRISEAYLKNGPSPDEKIPSFYRMFDECFIKKIDHGVDDSLARKKPKGNEAVSYPVTKLRTIVNIPNGSFPFGTHLKKFEDSLKRMMANARIPALIAVDSMKSEAPALYNGFMAGSFRDLPNKRTPYKSEDELVEEVKSDFEATWKHGFTTILRNQYLGKHLSNYAIKAHLLSLGYTSFEDVPEVERNQIYRSGNFPDWDTIVEEPISG